MTLTFDDSIDDIVLGSKDEGAINRSEDDLAVLVGQLSNQGPAGGILTDADDAGVELSCPNVSGTVGAGRLSNEHVNCDVPATFFLNWPRLDESKYLPLAKVREMEAWGHEIGGHSSHHHMVPRLESDGKVTEELSEQLLQMCWDRKNLSGITRLAPATGSLNLTTFAYPRGEYDWIGHPDLLERFDGGLTPPLDGQETRSIVQNDCGYRAARRTGGVANYPIACTDRSDSTPCPWAEHFPLDDSQTIWAIRTPSSVSPATDVGMQLDYPALPPNDQGAPGYDRAVEYESRSRTLKGWVDNAIANPASCGQANWIIYVFHSVCYRQTPACNPFGIFHQDFQNLLTWLRQKRKAGEIEIKTMAQVLGHTTERPMSLPDAGAQPTLVRNGGIYSDGDINRDYLPDCFQLDGVHAKSTFADARQATPVGDGGVDAGTTLVGGANGSRYYAWLWLTGKSPTEDGYLITRQDHARCALRVSPGNSYKVSFSYRKPDPARTCPFRDNPTARPCPLPGTGLTATSATAEEGDAGALGPYDFPFGAQGSDYEEFRVGEDVLDGGAAGLAVGAPGLADDGGVDGGLVPIYRLLYSFRRPQASGSMVKDGHWLEFRRTNFTPLQAPTSTWRRIDFIVPVDDAGLPIAVSAGIDSLSFGVELARNRATGQVGLDVDELSYCRLTNNNDADTVPACPDGGVN